MNTYTSFCIQQPMLKKLILEKYFLFIAALPHCRIAALPQVIAALPVAALLHQPKISSSANISALVPDENGVEYGERKHQQIKTIQATGI